METINKSNFNLDIIKRQKDINNPYYRLGILKDALIILESGERGTICACIYTVFANREEWILADQIYDKKQKSLFMFPELFSLKPHPSICDINYHPWWFAFGDIDSRIDLLKKGINELDNAIENYEKSLRA